MTSVLPAPVTPSQQCGRKAAPHGTLQCFARFLLIAFQLRTRMIRIDRPERRVRRTLLGRQCTLSRQSPYHRCPDTRDLGQFRGSTRKAFGRFDITARRAGVIRCGSCPVTL